MNKLQRIIIAVVLSLLILPALSYPAALRMVASGTSERTFSIDVTVDDIINLYGANIELAFDPAMIRVIGATEGSFLNSDGTGTSFMYMDNQQGRVIIGISRLGQVAGITGSGTLCSLSFKAKATGTCSLTFQNISLRDPNLTRLEVDSSGCSTEVNISSIPAYLYITPAGSTTASGKEFSVSLCVGRVVDLYGANIDLTFDPAIIQIIGATEGSFLNSDGTGTSFMHTDNRQGRVIIGISRLGQVAGVTGTGTLCSLTFRAKIPGQTMLRLENVSLKASDLEKIDIVITHGDVVITPPPTPFGVTVINKMQDGMIQVSWETNHEPDITYRIYYGTVSGSYPWSQTADSASICTLSGLTNGIPYYVAVSAYDKIGNEGSKSVESFAIPTGALSRITVTPDTITTLPGQKWMLTATGYDTYGNPVSPKYDWMITDGMGRIAAISEEDNYGDDMCDSDVSGTAITFVAGDIVGTGTIRVSSGDVVGYAAIEVIKRFQIVSEIGGVIDSGGSNPGFRLEIPGQALPIDVDIELRKVSVPCFVHGYDIGLAYQIYPSGLQFNIPATLTFSYTDKDSIVINGSVSETALQIYSCGTSTAVALNATINYNQNTLTAQINTISSLVAILAGSTQARINRLDPASGLPGELIIIEGAGFEKGETVRIDFGDMTNIVSTQVNEFTMFSAVFPVPELSAGTVTIMATGLNSRRQDTAVFKLVGRKEDEWRKPVEVPIQPPQTPSVVLAATTTTTIKTSVETVPAVRLKEVEVEKNRYQQLTLPGVEQTTEIGKPALPVVTMYIELPPDAKGVSIAGITVENSRIIEATYTIYPAQVPEVTGKPNKFNLDEATYQQTNWYPTEPASITVVPMMLRGHRVLLLKTFPLQYNPSTGQVKVNTGLSVTVKHDAGTIATIEQRLCSEEFETIVGNLMINYVPPTVVDDKPGVIDGADYLIITSNSLCEAIKPLVEWKQRKGLRVRVMGFPDGVGAADIKNEIQKAYNTWSPVPKYLLLVGDTNLIPACYQTPHPSIYEGNALIGTDLPYALLDGDDYFPDIFIGRLPISSPDETGQMVDKIISYERSPIAGDWLKRMVVAASRERSKWIETSDKIADFFGTKQYTVSKIYGNLDVKGALRDGCLIANHRDHGDSTNAMGDVLIGKIDGWETPRFTVDDVSCVTGSPVFFSMNCRTGWFDGRVDCLGEALLKQSSAIAFIGSTRISWTGYNDNMCLGFYEAMWPGFGSSTHASKPLLRLGPVLTYGKLNMYKMQGEGQYTQAGFEEFNLLGDPEMSIWSDNPRSFGQCPITTIGKLPMGNSTIEIKVMPETTVCLFKKDDVHLVTTIGISGTASLRVNITCPGTLSVTMTKPGYIPLEEEITIHSPRVCASPKEGYAVGTISINGEGFSTSEAVRVDFGTLLSAAVITTDVQGKFTAIFALQTQVAATTTVTITATGLNSAGTATELFTILPPGEVDEKIPLVRINLPSPLPQGSEFWVDIQVGDEGQRVNDLFGISFKLNYGNGIGIATSTSSSFVLPGEFMGKDVICTSNAGTSSAGIAITRKAGQSGANGYGVVVRVRLRLLDSTQQTITLSNIYANDSQGRAIQLTALPANVIAATIPLKIQLALSCAPGTSFWVKIEAGDRDNPAGNIYGLSCELVWNNPDVISIATDDNAKPGEFWGRDALCIQQAGKDRINLHIARIGTIATQVSGVIAMIKLKIADTAVVGTRVQLIINQFETYTHDNQVIKLTASPVSFDIGGMAVWPGDTNNDGMVNEFDILPIARYWGMTVLSRDITSAWEGTSVDASSGEVIYADTNGDGIVDAREILVLGKNWGKTHQVAGKLSAPSSQDIMDSDHSKYVEAYRAMYNLLKISIENPENETNTSIRNALSAFINKGVCQQLPEKNTLLQNYPNPFNPETWIPYSLNRQCYVAIKIYNLSGQLIRTLDIGTRDAGGYISRERAAYWDGKNTDGEEVASGVYFYQLHAGDEICTGKMVVLK
ncbi:MAG: C25 family cysteine peptidase [bacterium]